MQKFYFQAVTKEGKQISGYVSSESLDGARIKLKQNALSILTLEKRAMNALHKSGVEVFDFEAINPEHKVVKGTIESADAYAAYKKLKHNYKFEIKYLILNSTPAADRKALIEKGIPVSFKEKLKQEIEIERKKLEKELKNNKTADHTEEELAKILKSKEKDIVKARAEIDRVISEILPLLEENEDFINASKKREIEERIDLLVRLKHSNSIEHLKSLTVKLLDQIASDELFLISSNPEMQAEIERRRSQFSKVSEDFGKRMAKGVMGIQAALEKISLEDISQKIKNIKLIERVRNIIRNYFTVLFGVCVVFWLLLLLAKGLGFFSSEVFSFYFSSALIWYLTGASGVCMTAFFILSHPQLVDIKKQSLGLGILFFSLLVFSLEFPVLFFWI